MAYRKKTTTRRKTGATRRRTASSRNASEARRLTKLAYDLGKIEKGLQNPDSRISASKKAGKAAAGKKKEKKPLF